MKCVRCDGLMVTERFEDIKSAEVIEFFGIRCLGCGEILDPVILANRRNTAPIQSKDRIPPRGIRIPVLFKKTNI